MSETSGNKRTSKRGWFTIAFAASGWITAAFLGILDLPDKINKFHKELPEAVEVTGIWPSIDKRFGGAWQMVQKCNDDPFEVGNLDDDQAKPVGHGLDLTLEFEGKQVNGEIMSESDSEAPISRLSPCYSAG